jgi:hypothetical protein
MLYQVLTKVERLLLVRLQSEGVVSIQKSWPSARSGQSGTDPGLKQKSVKKR